MKYSKYYNDKGELGVLISVGFGAGWSTWDWDKKYGISLALDKRIIEKYLDGASCDEMSDYLESIGYKDVYMGGYSDLVLAFVPKGSKFVIDEYDGAESIEYLNDYNFVTA